MGDWHGYPQAGNTHPTRPWWTAPYLSSRGFFCQRTDDATARPDELAAYDAANPLPVPPPLCGQVWAEGGGSFMVAEVVATPAGFNVYSGAFTVDENGDPKPVLDQDAWPPTDALVAGPGAPWGRR